MKTPVDFDGPRELTDMLAFLNKQCHTQRTADGHLAANAGVVPEFQALLPADGGLTAAAATSLLVTFEKMAPELLGDPDASVYYQRTVPYYLRVLKKTTEKRKAVASECV